MRERRGMAVLQAVVHLICPAAALCLSSAWENFRAQIGNDSAPPLLPDFSWAGYKYGAAPIPRVAGPIFDVTKYGAVGDGVTYVDEKVQAAIDAAASAGGGVVFFPAGRYRFSPPGGSGYVLNIRSSNIVLRGDGASEEGTVLYMEGARTRDAFIRVKGAWGVHLTAITDTALRESQQIKVADPGALSNVECFYIEHQSVAYNEFYFGNATLQPEWEDVLSKGVYIHEPHCIQALDCNTGVVTMTEPLKVNLIKHDDRFHLYSFRPLENVGFERIMFESGWGQRAGPFCHHCTLEDDYGWNAIGAYATRNSWVDGCVFKDWSGAVILDRNMAFTVRQTQFTGKGGHFSTHSKRGYGNLFVDNVDTAGHWHGPSVEASDAGSVFLRHTMMPGQSLDMHGNNPHDTLLDSCTAGSLGRNGGKVEAMPHHGGRLVLWNYRNRGDAGQNYRFWRNSTGTNALKANYFNPIIVGLVGDRVAVDPTTVMHIEAQGQEADPGSLYEAQLELRLTGNHTGSMPYPVCVQGCGTCYGGGADDIGTWIGANTMLFVGICAGVAALLLLAIIVCCVRKAAHRRRQGKYAASSHITASTGSANGK